MKNSSKNLVRTAMLSVIRCHPDRCVVGVEVLGEQFAGGERVKKSTPTARTNGSANGSLINASSAVVAIARAAATIVAVAPTLDARSQVSLSVLVINSP